MGLYTQAVQQLYVAYFNRPADPVGLQYWEGKLTASNGSATTLAEISSAFSKSDEYNEAYGGKSSQAVVDTVYHNLFGRQPEREGLLYWANVLENKLATVSNIVTTIAAGALTTDADAYNNKVSAATAFTDGLVTTSQILNYAGKDALQLAKNYIASVTDAASLQAANDGLAGTIAAVVAAGDLVNNKGQTFTLTTGIDSFIGGNGNDSFVSTATTAQTLTSFDKLDGGAGNDELTWTSATNANVTLPSSLTISNIEKATLIGDAAVSVNTTGWTGLTNLSVTPIGAATVTSAATTDVTVTDNQGAADITVNGGKAVTITSNAATTGAITVGTTTAPADAVSITRTETNGGTAGTITVSGGTTVNISSTAANAVNTTHTNAPIGVQGGASTTSVTIASSPIATASASKAGVVANAVQIIDVNYNGGASTVAGKITSVSVDSYTTLDVKDNALKTLSLAHGSSNVIIDNSSSLATVTNKTLGLTVNALTGGTLDDADVYTTLNVTATGANSTLANITTGAVTAMTLAGSKVLTLTSTTGLSALKTLTVSGSAGIKADLSGATVTAVDTSATTGASTVTIDASKATFTGGAGADTVTNSAGTSTKAINLGAGDDSLAMTAVAATPTAKIDGGAGTDNLSMTAALAATASASSSFAGIVSNFEKLTLTGATNQTIDLDVLGKFSYVSTAGGNGLTLSNLPTGGSLVLTGAGTAYTIGNSAFASGTNDTVNLSLTDGSGAGVAFAATGITASGVENFVITTADTQATPTGTFNDTVTLLGNSAKSITVSGNAGLTLTATSTALTNVDASGVAGTDITPGFSWTSGALAAAAVVKGSATGTNTIDASAATGGAVTYTGGTGNDSFTATNGKGNIITLGDGTNSATVSSGNNTITGGTGGDTVVATTGNNTVSLGNGANFFTASSGNNTYTGGTGVDTVTVGGGSKTAPK
ncbi:MAG: DUF4214 domain-containing protein [Burkholderiales bacterium]|nr:DUF4214 domain-containing protein [Burkholderiales bacterium]